MSSLELGWEYWTSSFVLFDLTLVLLSGAPSPRLVGFLAASYLLKLLVCHLAGRSAARNEAIAEPA